MDNFNVEILNLPEEINAAVIKKKDTFIIVLNLNKNLPENKQILKRNIHKIIEILQDII